MAYYTHSTNVTGSFVNKETDVLFEYSNQVTCEWAKNEMGATHIIFVLDGVRFAKVLKTVVHILIDEDDSGQPVWEKWDIKKHKIY